jgi:hypothetical protein
MENATLRGPRVTMGRRMAQGAAAGLILISFFVFGVDHPNPDWPKLWMLKPLILVPLAGSMGGLLYYWINPLRQRPGWKRIGANMLGLLVFLIVLWLGTVLGLNGTMWD